MKTAQMLEQVRREVARLRGTGFVNDAVAQARLEQRIDALEWIVVKLILVINLEES